MYYPEYLTLFQWSGAPLEWGFLVLSIFLLGGFYLIAPFLVQHTETLMERTEKLKKQGRLKELIMMKDLQTEIENEVEAIMTGTDQIKAQ